MQYYASGNVDKGTEVIVLGFFNNYTTFLLIYPTFILSFTYFEEYDYSKTESFPLIKPRCTGQNAFPVEIRLGTKGSRHSSLIILPPVHFVFTWQMGMESGL